MHIWVKTEGIRTSLQKHFQANIQYLLHTFPAYPSNISFIRPDGRLRGIPYLPLITLQGARTIKEDGDIPDLMTAPDLREKNIYP
jgi:hypothetical protein